jgi:stage V sporulation protein S
MELLKVSSTSRPASVAGAVANALATQSKLTIQAVGAGAVNQAVKAIAIARGYITPLGYDLSVVPAFTTINVPDDTEPKSGIKLIISKVY